jgi:phosphoglycolate phosphatase-like HAD superfamily hydrolase
LAERVFGQKARFVEDAELVLRSLHANGFRLGLLTAGEAWVQQKRIAEFHLQGIFHAVEVVEKKTADEFRAFCKKHAIDKDQCWVVGEIKSEPTTATAHPEANVRANSGRGGSFHAPAKICGTAQTIVFL